MVIQWLGIQKKLYFRSILGLVHVVHDVFQNDVVEPSIIRVQLQLK